jgi:hypothetical protein
MGWRRRLEWLNNVLVKVEREEITPRWQWSVAFLLKPSGPLKVMNRGLVE